MASEGARVELLADLAVDAAGSCVVVRGRDAVFDGLERDVRLVGSERVVAVDVLAPGAQVKNLHVVGTAVGIAISGAADVTLFHNYVQATEAGVHIDAAPNARLMRNVLLGGKAAVSIGAKASGECADSPSLTSTGVVLNHNHIERADVGVAACESLPVLRNNTIVRNGIGVRLANPSTAGVPNELAAPWDACICAPSYPGVSAGTALFFSSGCKGCQVHEAWLTDLRAKGHDILLRPSGPESEQKTAEFDAFVLRCTPQIIDSIGISGCVPNYGCLTNDIAFKVREGDNALTRETEINSPEQLAAYEVACQQMARAHYAPPSHEKGVSCVIHPIHDNVVCESVEADFVAAGGLKNMAGASNACAITRGWSDAGTDACARSCPPSPNTPEPPAARTKEGSAAAPVPPPPRTAAPAAAANEASPPPPPPAPPAPPPPAAETAQTTAVTGGAAQPAGPSEVARAHADAQPAPDSTVKHWALIAAGALVLAGIFAVLWLRASAAAKSARED